MQWFVQPEVVRLDIGDGEWIDVKKELTKGEMDRRNALLMQAGEEGRMAVNVLMMSKAETMAYLVDWSLKDAKGQTIDIEQDAAKLSALDSMSKAGFDAISEAIKAHVDAMDKERPEKKASRGARRLKATSVSAA